MYIISVGNAHPCSVRPAARARGLSHDQRELADLGDCRADDSAHGSERRCTPRHVDSLMNLITALVRSVELIAEVAASRATGCGACSNESGHRCSSRRRYAARDPRLALHRRRRGPSFVSASGSCVRRMAATACATCSIPRRRPRLPGCLCLPWQAPLSASMRCFRFFASVGLGGAVASLSPRLRTPESARDAYYRSIRCSRGMISACSRTRLQLLLSWDFSRSLLCP